MNFDELKIIKLPKHDDSRGSLTFIEENSIIPFEIKRVYYTYNLKSDIGRGGHAHKVNYGLIIAISGSFIVKTDDYFNKKEFYLSKPNEGLLIPPHYWRELCDIKKNYRRWTKTYEHSLTNSFFAQSDLNICKFL